jgi:subtilisin family serine protease
MHQRLLFLVLAIVLTGSAPLAWAAGRPADDRLDRELRVRAQTARGHSRVILRIAPGVDPDTAIRRLRGTVGRRLPSVGGEVADVPDSSLTALARVPGVTSVSLDRRVQGTLERTGATIGSTYVHDTLGLDGSNVGVAIVDSGVAAWHDDLGSDRLARFVDFVSFQSSPYDDYGHGTHVAGIIAGSGYDSGGRRRGIAPGATLLVEKVLDAAGQGYISNVIAAIDYAIANKDALHLRIVNLSVAAAVYESYTTDPLTLAAKRAVEAGLVVVSAAGNLGKGADGLPQYGGIGAPGNAPWVITVGASSHNGTVDRSDDTVAAFSSRGPSAIDFHAKPDLVAPGVGIESLTEAGTTLYNTKPLMRLWGTVQTATEPYLSLSGTSMAAPVVSGTIALMLQANPALTPNLVKAILEYTAESHVEYNGLTQGAGFLNARGAVQLAQTLAGSGHGTQRLSTPDPTPWSSHITWGNYRIGGGTLDAAANAWRTSVTWGSALTPEGEHVTWGTVTGSDPSSSLVDPRLWGTSGEADNIVWGTGTDSDNIVWGTVCGGSDCVPAASLRTSNIVWGTNILDESQDIVWGPAIRREPRIAAADPPPVSQLR